MRPRVVLELARALDALDMANEPSWCGILRVAVRAEVDERHAEAEQLAAIVYGAIQDAREPIPPAFGMTPWTAALTSLGNVSAVARERSGR